MLGSSILDLAIGMVFVYLLLSLIVTAANELIAARLQSRGKHLWEGISHLLSPKKARELYNHPLIDGLSQSKRPSYIASRTFALALLEVIAGDGTPLTPANLSRRIEELPEALRKPLAVLYREAHGNLDAFKANIEVWFNNSMDRVSGWYKKKTQYVMLAIAAFFTVLLNIDSMALLEHLSRDSALRAALVQNAAETAKSEPAEREASLQKTIAQLNGLKLPIGWSHSDATAEGLDPERLRPDLSNGFIASLRSLWEVFSRHFLGWSLTALAASLGAPFWFDLLNKFMNIRASGKAPEEEPKKPREIPQPAAPGDAAVPSVQSALQPLTDERVEKKGPKERD